MSGRESTSVCRRERAAINQLLSSADGGRRLSDQPVWPAVEQKHIATWWAEEDVTPDGTTAKVRR